MLSSIMLTVTIAVVLIMVPRIYGNWLQFRHFAEEGDIEQLLNLQSQQNGWVLRHFSCAILGLILSVFLRYSSEPGASEQLTRVTAVYSMISFIFTFVESILSHKISSLIVTQPQTVKSDETPANNMEL